MPRRKYDHEQIARQVYDHLRKYPGLSAFEIARALGYSYGDGTRYVNTRIINIALTELAGIGRARRETLPWPCPGRVKQVWYAIDYALAT